MCQKHRLWGGREAGREGYASSGPYVKLWPQELWGVSFGAGHAWGLRLRGWKVLSKSFRFGFLIYKAGGKQEHFGEEGSAVKVIGGLAIRLV